MKPERPASPAGYYAGFTVGNAGLLDATVLSGVRLRKFLNGIPQETNTDASLLQLNVLPGGQTRVGFPTTKPFDAVSTPMVSVLDNMQLYYGFGLKPRAFGQAKQVAANAYVYSDMGQLVRLVPLAAEAGAVVALPTLPTGLCHMVVRGGAGNRVAAQRLVVAGQ